MSVVEPVAGGTENDGVIVAVREGAAEHPREEIREEDPALPASNASSFWRRHPFCRFTRRCSDGRSSLLRQECSLLATMVDARCSGFRMLNYTRDKAK